MKPAFILAAVLLAFRALAGLAKAANTVQAQLGQTPGKRVAVLPNPSLEPTRYGRLSSNVRFFLNINLSLLMLKSREFNNTLDN